MQSPKDIHDSLFIYNERYRKLICKSCKYAVNGSSVQRHLLQNHRHVSLIQRKNTIQYANTLHLSHDNSDPPEWNHTPIQGLQLLNGYECQVCQYICVERYSMEQHCRKEHEWKKGYVGTWIDCHVQSWFPSQRRKYFKTRSPIIQDQGVPVVYNREVMDDLVSRLKQRDEREEEQLATMMERELEKTEATPWLERTGWATIFAGKDMKQLYESIQRPPKTDAIMMKLWNRTDIVLRSCIQGIRDCRKRGWLPLLFLLNSNEPGVPNTQLFNIPQEQDTIERYIGMWQRLMCFCIRALSDVNKVFSLPFTLMQLGCNFTEMQSEALQMVYDLLFEDAIDHQGLDDSIFTLSCLLIQHSIWFEETSALIYFFNILGWNDTTKTWRKAPDITGYIAGIQFCNKIIILEYAIPQAQRPGASDTIVQYSCHAKAQRLSETISQSTTHDSLTNPLDTFKIVREQYLVIDQHSPFSYLQQLMRYAKEIARSTKSKGRILWSKDKQRLFYNGQPLDMKQFKQFIRKLLDAANELAIDLLFDDRDWMDSLDLNKVIDDHSNTSLRYSFVKEEENNLCDGVIRMVERLKQHNCVNEFISSYGNQLEFQADQVHQYTAKYNQFLELILILVHITAGQPARGTEITSLRYCNWITSPRNIYILDGQVMIVTTYHKSQRMMDDPKVIISIQ